MTARRKTHRSHRSTTEERTVQNRKSKWPKTHMPHGEGTRSCLDWRYSHFQELYIPGRKLIFSKLIERSDENTQRGPGTPNKNDMAKQE